jgi:hypothetical protein
MNNVISLCQYRHEKEAKAIFLEFEKELAKIGRRLHWDFILFDQELEQTIIWGMTHEQIFSNQK